MIEELLSIVVSAGSNSSELLRLIDGLSHFLQTRFKNYEIIIVNDRADPVLSHELSEYVAKTKNLRVLSLARYYGDATAILAGMQHAIGGFTVVLRPSDDPAIIDTLFAEINANTDIVFAVSDICTDWRGKILSWIAWMSRLPMPVGAGQVALLRRRALNTILTLRDRVVHLPLLASYLGLRVTTVNIPAVQSMTFREMFEKLDAICAYSPWPLWGLAIGVLALCGFATLLALTQWIIGYSDQHSLIMFLAMLSITGLAGMMVILASFVGRILQETKRQPMYNVLSEESSRKVDIASIVQRK